ncbi:Superkiller viralicidic activity 2-like 2 [Schistosoma japonicum]|uniref:Superkiller viralicidic activity 2-like 2 n=1 Tax=Schistosoma japonicum TaxID=6182 RepID=A0A4Z2CYZ9_SCHJA|nr:Superkiller viralicidic activity 2-like 2 [Schistosoma japonicum]
MSSFGLDLDELTSAFDPKKPSSETHLDTSSLQSGDFEEKKRKAEASLKPLLEVEGNSEHAFLKRPRLSVNDTLEFNAPRIQIHKIGSPETCTHEVAVPPDVEYKPIVKDCGSPARTFPFTLDAFQQQAIICIDNNQSVLLSAHTSAGKTVVAEYAIATALREKQRVIYTTPIKALSNQKYREFFEAFPEVGLLTGDATINPSASVLIMTTEILQSMLYKGASMVREVGWVIFDEIHYMRDPERGVVWEETIVLLPDSVRYVFLSATIPNARQFAEWISHLHHQPCHVVSSDCRPVPLRHYLYPLGSEGLFLVLDEGKYLEQNFERAMRSFLSDESSNRRQKSQVDYNKRSENNVIQIVRLVKHRSLEPIIVFSFSKKECEIYALQLAKFDFTTDAEKKVVDEVFRNAIDGLSPEDRSLPQVESVLPLLKRGIGIHHGGLLPLLKETIEILFSENLIKCLFATETFAMGLNMPARTVLFTSARKYDGHSYRWITSGEYIQMSGRAGRRGKDDSGTVILMVDESMTSELAHQIMMGPPPPLNSAFHITYNMLLNLLRVEEINPEYMMERSFCQFQNYASLPNMYKELNELRATYASTIVEDEESVESYHQIQLCFNELVGQQWQYIRRPQYIVPFLQPGRLVKVYAESMSYGWGAVINLKKRQRKDRSSTPESFYILDCLLCTSPSRSDSDELSSVVVSGDTIATDSETGSLITATSSSDTSSVAEIIPIRLDCVVGISAVRLVIPNDLRSKEARQGVLNAIEKVKVRMGGSLPILDPIADMHISDPRFLEVNEKVTAFQERLQHHWLHDDPRLSELLKVYKKKEQIRKRIDALTANLSSKVSLIQLEELSARKRVLRRLNFVSEYDVIELKGCVACEITSADELLLTELLFDGIFNRLSSEHIAALLSCFVFEERASEMPKLTKELSDALRTLQDTARRIARISNECRLPVDEDNYVDSFKPHLMDLVDAWTRGASFASVCSMTDLFEGTIIRTLRLLEELLRQMANAARTIGSNVLEKKFIEAIEKIKRDIVFAASLYL